MASFPSESFPELFFISLPPNVELESVRIYFQFYGEVDFFFNDVQ